MKITDEIADILKSYVYVYIDPRNGEPFYIGKGKGNRLFSHLDDQSDTEKVARIAEIRQNGKESQIDILRYGLSDSEAAIVEVAAIDLIGKAKLTNRVSGYHEHSFGRITSSDLIAMFAAKPVKVRHKAILITINKLYRSSMTPLELYEATRGIWVVGLRRNKAEYAMTVYQGIVREVYRIDQWYPAGTLEYQTENHRILGTAEDGSSQETSRMSFVTSMSAFQLEKVVKIQFGMRIYNAHQQVAADVASLASQWLAEWLAVIDCRRRHSRQWHEPKRGKLSYNRGNTKLRRGSMAMPKILERPALPRSVGDPIEVEHKTQLTPSTSEADDPIHTNMDEVFHLLPRSRERVTVRIRETRRARFVFVDETDVPDDTAA